MKPVGDEVLTPTLKKTPRLQIYDAVQTALFVDYPEYEYSKLLRNVGTHIPI
jgi:hypothetical protein